MNWADLRLMREQGLKPSLPVIVTTRMDRLARTFADGGCGVIEHKPGTPFHAELLDGLNVWLFTGSCDRANSVVRAMNAKGVTPASLKSWCECSQSLQSNPVPCATAKEWA